MKLHRRAVSVVLALLMGAVPSLAWADEPLETATIATTAVSAPITVGGITYTPCESCGGGVAALPLGTIESPAVTAPLVAGDIIYVPLPACYFCGPWAW